ncbi:Beta-N-acetylhexosaminidase [Streptococcus pyogenes]|nr:Beta-N-acetylhexosaminidase [Streptococcus pyogenes]
MSANDQVVGNLKQALEARGYEVTINDGTTRVKGEILAYRNDVDLALMVVNVVDYEAQNNYRIQWETAMFNEVPWYVYEVSTVLITRRICTMPLWSKQRLMLITIILIRLQPFWIV